MEGAANSKPTGTPDGDEKPKPTDSEIRITLSREELDKIINDKVNKQVNEQVRERVAQALANTPSKKRAKAERSPVPSSTERNRRKRRRSSRLPDESKEDSPKGSSSAQKPDEEALEKEKKAKAVLEAREKKKKAKTELERLIASSPHIATYVSYQWNYNRSLKDFDSPAVIIDELSRSGPTVQRSNHTIWKSLAKPLKEIHTLRRNNPDKRWSDIWTTEKSMPRLPTSTQLQALRYLCGKEPDSPNLASTLITKFEAADLLWFIDGLSSSSFWAGAMLDDHEFRQKYMEEGGETTPSNDIDVSELPKLMRRVFPDQPQGVNKSRSADQFEGQGGPRRPTFIATGNSATASDATIDDPRGNALKDSGSKGNNRAGKDSKDNNRAGKDSKGDDQAGKDSKGDDRADKDSKGNNQADKDSKRDDQAGKDSKGDDQAGKDSKGDDQAGKDSKGNNQADKDSKGDDLKSGSQAGIDSNGGNQVNIGLKDGELTDASLMDSALGAGSRDSDMGERAKGKASLLSSQGERTQQHELNLENDGPSKGSVRGDNTRRLANEQTSEAWGNKPIPKTRITLPMKRYPLPSIALKDSSLGMRPVSEYDSDIDDDESNLEEAKRRSRMDAFDANAKTYQSAHPLRFGAFAPDLKSTPTTDLNPDIAYSTPFIKTHQVNAPAVGKPVFALKQPSHESKTEPSPHPSTATTLVNASKGHHFRQHSSVDSKAKTSVQTPPSGLSSILPGSQRHVKAGSSAQGNLSGGTQKSYSPTNPSPLSKKVSFLDPSSVSKEVPFQTSSFSLKEEPESKARTIQTTSPSRSLDELDADEGSDVSDVLYPAPMETSPSRSLDELDVDEGSDVLCPAPMETDSMGVPFQDSSLFPEGAPEFEASTAPAISSSAYLDDPFISKGSNVVSRTTEMTKAFETMQQHTKTISDLKEELARQQEKIESLENELYYARRDHETESMSNGVERAVLRKAKNDAEAAYNGSKLENQKISTENGVLKTKIEGLEAENQRFSTENGVLKTKIEGLEAENQRLQGLCEDQRLKLEDNDRRIQSNQPLDVASDIYSRIDKLQQQVNSLQDLQSEAHSKIQKLEASQAPSKSVFG